MYSYLLLSEGKYFKQTSAQPGGMFRGLRRYVAGAFEGIEQERGFSLQNDVLVSQISINIV